MTVRLSAQLANPTCFFVQESSWFLHSSRVRSRVTENMCFPSGTKRRSWLNPSGHVRFVPDLSAYATKMRVSLFRALFYSCLPRLLSGARVLLFKPRLYCVDRLVGTPIADCVKATRHASEFIKPIAVE